MRLLRRKTKKHGLDTSRDLPVHIAVIMDGNGRWAARRGLPRNAGHREGANTLKRVVKECNAIGIKYLTAFAFSTENWNRPRQEVNALMQLLLEFLQNAEKELAGTNIRITVIGDTDKLSEEIRNEIDRVVANTAANTGLNLVIALNYGSRCEIAAAAARIARDVREGRIEPEDVDEELFSNYLYTSGIPDPDLVIRPSGEYRLSNFLLWQSSYSEFWYSDILWPDFSKEHLYQAISDYQNRNRRFGGL
ncbi:MAG: isoprenyl transferase [Acetivibrionales bacterium]|jgi:undecaprenyl diphosphate synthase|nr:isoprenyl transferase [Bacillota bacterium]NLP07951.1 isoprenyl transferase [Clostridiaceae bacterium]HOA54630.1 isoprenyl transferase [Clostridiales bacterium]HQD30327.1 isoprenyl transferase [Clostridiales bacterium]